MHNPLVPETLEGWGLLHLLYRIRWELVRERDDLAAIAAEAARVLEPAAGEGSTTWVQMLGHKADLMVVCMRKGFEGLAQAQLAISRSELGDLLELTTSYVSVVELGMYDMTAKIHKQLGAKFTPGSQEFEAAFDAEMETQRGRVMSRLFLDVPKGRYVCFYPMDKRRGETFNWYAEPFEKRAAMMLEHGMIGRHYAGKVTQVISGSIGFDDWEWGVDLFADDPLVFKKLIYEMRFDEASARYAEFGPFYTGLQFSASQLGELLAGRVPALLA